MADIRPFQGIHYNPLSVKDFSRVICPPYDIISAQQQAELYQRDEHNFIRIEHGRELPGDKDTDNKYTRAAATLEGWLKEKILVKDESPCIYIDEHQFKHQGKTYRRRGIVCRVKLEEWDKKIVRPHEGTLSKPKGDRLSLLWALRADTSSIMALYEDSDKRIAEILDEGTECKPLFSVGAIKDESHRFWAIRDEKIIVELSKALIDQPLYIADGHHRYESALNYQREKRSSSRTGEAIQAFDFVMMTLLDFDDPGLVILPAHRTVRGLKDTAIEKMMSSLGTIFSIEEIPSAEVIGRAQTGKLLAEKTGEVKLLLCGPGKDKFYRLTLNDFSKVKSMIPYFHSELYHKLDVSIVDHVILEELLGLTHEAAGTYIDYTNEAGEAINRVQKREYQLSIIVNPVKPQAIKYIADSGDRMPRKSTYFYPKVPAGLTVYRLE